MKMKKKQHIFTVACTWSLAVHVIVVPFRELKSNSFKNSLTLLIAGDPRFSEPVFFRQNGQYKPKRQANNFKFTGIFFLLTKGRPSTSRSLPLSILLKSSGKVVTLGDRFNYGRGVIPQISDVCTC